MVPQKIRVGTLFQESMEDKPYTPFELDKCNKFVVYAVKMEDGARSREGRNFGGFFKVTKKGSSLTVEACEK